MCVVLKSAGIGATNPQHPKLLELLEQGAQVQDFEDAARKSVEAGKGFAYALGIVKNAMDDAKRRINSPPAETAYQRSKRELFERAVGRSSAPAGNVVEADLMALEVAK